MENLFSSQTFATFGPSRFETGSPPPSAYAIHSPRSSGLRARVQQECPRCPGVYGMFDAHGELIYIGKAKSLRARLFSYFRPQSRDPKAGRILGQTRTLAWETLPSEFAALLRELELIRRWRPRFNVHGQPRRYRRSYVCLGRRPAPHVFLAPRPPAGAIGCFGPVPGGQRAREAVRRLNDWFQLRDCPQPQEMVFADQGELFPVLRAAGCLRYEIGTCLGPCAAACSQPAYSDQVRAARAFLAGNDDTPLQTLERDMTAAATAMEFERAAALRDRLDSLRWLREQLQRLRRACEQYSFIYPVRGHSGRDLWYLIHGGCVVAVVPRPHDKLTGQLVLTAIMTVYEPRQGNFGLPRLDEMDGVFLVDSWFRQHPEQRVQALETPSALAACQAVQGAMP